MLKIILSTALCVLCFVLSFGNTAADTSVEINPEYENGYLNKDGSLVTDVTDDELTTGFIYVLPGEKVYFELVYTPAAKPWARVTEYDEKGNFIKRSSNLFDSNKKTERTYNSYVVTENTYQIRVSYSSYKTILSRQYLRIIKKGPESVQPEPLVNVSSYENGTVSNAQVSEYLKTDYSSVDYTWSAVPIFAGDGFDRPRSFRIIWKPVDGVDFYRVEFSADGLFDDTIEILCFDRTETELVNLIPTGVSAYKIYSSVNGTETEIKSGVFSEINGGGVRMLSIDGIHNVRDIGGWRSEFGGFLKYGLIYRGSALDEPNRHVLTEKGRVLLYDQLKIRMEIDLRGGDVESESSVIGEDCWIRKIKGKSYLDGFEDTKTARTVFDSIFFCIENDIPVYIHCSAGADRTGFYIAMLEGLLGVSESDITKDWELSSFTDKRFTDYYRRYRSMGEEFIFRNWSGLMERIRNLEGESLQEKFETYFRDNLGYEISELESIRNKMIFRDSRYSDTI